MPELRTTTRTKIKRHPERASVDRATAYSIVDQARICHLGVRVHGHMRVLPTAFARVGDQLYLHGAVAAGMLSDEAIVDLCVTVTLLDGLVLAKSAFAHSMNYRSVMLVGAGRLVTDEDEKRRALDAFTDKTLPGRAMEARSPSGEELQITRVVALRIDEGSIKTRTGPPKDSPIDKDGPQWAGVLPLPRRIGEPVSASVAPLPPSVLAAGPECREATTKEGWLLSTDPRRIRFDAVHSYLAHESYWAKGISRESFRQAIHNSLPVGGYQGGEQLAFARVVTDRATFAYLCDVFVLPGIQRKGLGSQLMRFIRELPELKGVRRFLLATKDGHDFYRRLGWESTDGDGRLMRINARTGVSPVR